LIHGNVIKREFNIGGCRLIFRNAFRPAITHQALAGHQHKTNFFSFLPNKSFDRIKKIPDTHIHDLFDFCFRPQSDHAFAECIQRNVELWTGIIELVFQFRIE
jgi:hypothetical protein